MLGQDWSEWDETCAYMVSRDPLYLAANLNVHTFETLGVDLVALYDADKQPQLSWRPAGGADPGPAGAPDRLSGALGQPQAQCRHLV